MERRCTFSFRAEVLAGVFGEICGEGFVFQPERGAQIQVPVHIVAPPRLKYHYIS